MGRKNRKGRTGDQNPKRFYRSKRDERALDVTLRESSLRKTGPRRPPLDDLSQYDLPDDTNTDDTDTGYEAALLDPTGATIGALPRPGEWDAREISRREPAATQICGRCAEWSPKGGHLDPSARGQCLHPGSGFSFPPANMEACPFFH